MGNRGFQVVALSGELSQQERTHALQALRDGRARVCIATDVAARGIDLPGLDLVIHADLPTNSETLLHRSGRTGRAGQKGVSALIVTPAEFKKAQRLLQGAKVVAEWAKAPSADEVRARDEVRLLEHPALMQPVTEDERAVAAAHPGPRRRRTGRRRLCPAVARGPLGPRRADGCLRRRRPAAPKPRAEFGASVWFAVSVGRVGPGRGALASAEDLRCRRHHQGRHRRDPRAGGRDLRADRRRPMPPASARGWSWNRASPCAASRASPISTRR